MKNNVVLGILIMVAGLVLWGCSNGTSSTTKTYTVRYEVTGTGEVTEANISYFNETGHLEDIGIVPLPWEKTFTVSANDVIFGFGLTVTHTDHDNGSLTATISIDGKAPKTATDDTFIQLSYPKVDL